MPSLSRACVVNPPLKITVTMATIKTVDNISCLAKVSVFRMANAKATAPRNPAENEKKK